MSFKTTQLNKSDAGVAAAVTELEDGALLEGDVTVRAGYSTIN